MTEYRLPARSGEVVDRARPVRFRWNGGTYTGLAGDTVVSALLANGVSVFSRSPVLRRPRGVLTASYADPNCTVRVGDELHVRAAHRLVRDDLDVHLQDAAPLHGLGLTAARRSLRTRPGLRPRVTATGSGGPAGTRRHVHVDVLVVGGGPAGAAAALAAADAGADVLLVEEEHDLGGHLRWGGPADRWLLADQGRRVRAHPGVEVLLDSVAAGRYDENLVAVVRRPDATPDGVEHVVTVRAATLVVAAGLHERPFVFTGNDLPGVVLATAARRLTTLHAVRLGERAVVVSANPEGDRAAADLRAAGLDVRLLDARAGELVREVRGHGRVQEVVLVDGSREEADLLVTATGWTARTALLTMAGGRPEWDEASARFRPAGDLPPSVLATGGVTGDGTRDELVAHGTASGEEAARRARGERSRPVPRLPAGKHPALFLGPTPGFVDLAADVRSSDVAAAVADGVGSVDAVRSRTGAGGGPGHGALEHVNLLGAFAAASRTTLAEVGTPPAAPPLVPVTLAALAGRRDAPTRVSPVHAWHVAHGMVPVVTGEWVRPAHYGDPVGEARAVRQRVGVADVTAEALVELHGSDAAQLLELVHTDAVTGLVAGDVGRGLLCSDDGVVLDESRVGRLGAQRWLLATSTLDVDALVRWLERWRVTTGTSRVHLTALTSAYARFEVAGPRTADLLARVVAGADAGEGRDVAAAVAVGEARVAGVDGCRLWRARPGGSAPGGSAAGGSGSGGSGSGVSARDVPRTEVHVPAGFGLHVWEALLAAGADLGVAPVGRQALRVLRLEAGRPATGVDTDGVTRPGMVGLRDHVDLAKHDFVGRPELAWADPAEEPALVTLRPFDADVVPPPSSPVVVGTGTVAGRVTSSGTSPSLGRSVCLARVTPDLAAPGTVVTVVLPDGARARARVTDPADPAVVSGGA